MKHLHKFAVMAWIAIFAIILIIASRPNCNMRAENTVLPSKEHKPAIHYQSCYCTGKASNAARQTPPPVLESRPRRILLDLGANCGNSFELLNQNIDESYLVEPQTAVYEKWLKPRASSSVHIFNAAMSDRNVDSAPFFIDSPFTSDLCTFDKGYPHGASSLSMQNAFVNGVAPVQQNVRVYDIVDFLCDIMHITPEDHLLLKIDVEGGEEAILRRLISANMLYMVDDLRVEWHESARNFQKEFEQSIFRYEQWLI